MIIGFVGVYMVIQPNCFVYVYFWNLIPAIIANIF